MRHIKVLLFSSVLMSLIIVGDVLSNPQPILEKGHKEDQYYFVADGGLYRTDDNGDSFTLISNNHWFGNVWIDARDSCMYARIANEDFTFDKAVTFDEGQTWDTLDVNAFGSSGATGREPGEIYGNASPYIRYSTDYGQSYDEYRSRDISGKLTIGHADGEVYSRSSQLRRSTDYGETFEFVFEEDDSTELFVGQDVLDTGPEEGELFLFRPLYWETGFYLSYSDDNGETFTRLCRIQMPDVDTDNYEWYYDMTTGYDSGEITISWKTWDMNNNYWILNQYSDDYGENWEEIEVLNQITNGIGTDQIIQGISTNDTFFKSYPNPFNSSTLVSFTLPTASRVSLSVYDESGRFVEELVTADLQAGTHEYSWRTDQPSGVYICRLEYAGNSRDVKLVLTK